MKTTYGLYKKSLTLFYFCYRKRLHTYTIYVQLSSLSKQDLTSSEIKIKLISKSKRTAFKRLSVNLASKVGCLYFFENLSLTTDLLPTKEVSKTLYNNNKTKLKTISYCKFNFLQIHKTIIVNHK